MLKLAESSTRALKGFWIFHHPMGGIVKNPPLSHLLDVITRNGKRVQKLVRNIYKSISVNAAVQILANIGYVNIWIIRGHQRSKFSDLQYSSGNMSLPKKLLVGGREENSR